MELPIHCSMPLPDNWRQRWRWGRAGRRPEGSWIFSRTRGSSSWTGPAGPTTGLEPALPGRGSLNVPSREAQRRYVERVSLNISTYNTYNLRQWCNDVLNILGHRMHDNIMMAYPYNNMQELGQSICWSQAPYPILSLFSVSVNLFVIIHEPTLTWCQASNYQSINHFIPRHPFITQPSSLISKVNLPPIILITN